MGKPSAGNAALPPAEHIGREETSGGSETSQYPEESKSTETPLVVASESGSAQTEVRASGHALRTRGCRTCCPGRGRPGRSYQVEQIVEARGTAHQRGQSSRRRNRRPPEHVPE